MSVSILTEPSTPAGAYDFQALRYQFVDDWAYTSIANDAGKLQLTVGASAVAEIEVGDSVWIESLTSFPYVDSAISTVTAKGATTITVSIAYSGSYATTGDIRLMEVQSFTIITGGNNSNNPYRTREISMRPDPNGVYSINPYQEVISRFDFGAPILGTESQYAYAIGYQVYLTSAGLGSNKSAFKSITGTNPGGVIRYNGVPNIVTYLEAGGTSLKTNLETASTQELESAGDQSQDIEVYAFDCTTYAFTFSDPFDEGFVTYTPQDWVEVTVDGLNVTAVTFDFSGQSAGEYSWSIEYDDGANTKIFNFTIQVQAAIDCRESCGGRRFFWWSRDGAWCSYEFNLGIDSAIEGGSSELRQIGNEVSAVRYDRQQEVLQLVADVEGETVFNHLKQILYALNLYEATTFTADTQVYDLYYFSQASGASKRVQPFLATSNRFSINIVKGAIEERINEGR